MGIRSRKLMVLPDAARVEEAMIAAAREGSGFVDGSAFCTFAQLIDRFLGAEQMGRRSCSLLTSRVVVSSAARKLEGAPFGAWVREPSFARMAQDLIFDLKSGQLTPPAFASAVSALPVLQADWARHLAQVYAGYEQRMGKLKLADREDRTAGALRSVEGKSPPSALQQFAEIEIAHLYDFPRLQLDFILALARRCDREGIGFRLRIPAGGNPFIDAVVDPVLAEFERHGQQLSHVEAFKEDLSGESPFAVLGRGLFSADVNVHGAQELAGHLTVLSAGTARDEAKQLARRALRFLERGTPPERIAIAYRDVGEEADWLAEALEDFGIPAYVRRGAPLGSTAAGRMALALPLLPDEDFRADHVARLLSSRYAPAISTGAPNAPMMLLAQAALRDNHLGASEGRGAYELRLSALRARLDKRGVEGVARDVGQILDRCQQLISLASGLAAVGPASELLAQWWSCVGELGLSRAIRRREQREEEATALGRAVLHSLARDQAAFEALQVLVAELDAALKLSGAGSQPMSRRTFHRWLLDAAADFNLAPTGPRIGAVSVLGVRQLVGRRFSHVLLGGLAEGRFPGQDPAASLLGEEERWAINRSVGREVFRLRTGEVEGRASRRLAEDRLLFYLALTSARETVTLSYARTNSGGQPQAPSPFLDEIQRLVGAQVDHRGVHAVAAVEDVGNEQELRERIALEALSPQALRSEAPQLNSESLRQRFATERWYQEAEELVAVERERLRYFSDPQRPPGPYTGLVSGSDVEGALADVFRYGVDKPVSASTLNRFGNCGFQGFVVSALHLRPIEEPGEELDAKERGSFWHSVLEVLFPRLQAAGLLNQPLERIPEDFIDQALDEATNAVEREGGHLGHPALWALAREKARSMVRRVLRAETRGIPFEAHAPAYTELHFGRPDAPARWRTVKIPGEREELDVFVDGKIDRVDLGPNAIGVLDYKSSIATGQKLMKRLLVSEFQLPLYLYAAKQSGEGREIRGAWLSFRDGSHYELGEALREHGEPALEDLLSSDPDVRSRLREAGARNLIDQVQSLVSTLRAGQFGIRPLDCGECDFRTVCRITERRLFEVRES